MKEKRRSIIVLAAIAVLACMAWVAAASLAFGANAEPVPAEISVTESRVNLLKDGTFDSENFNDYWNFRGRGEIKENGRNGKYFAYNAASQASINDGYFSTNGYTGDFVGGKGYVIGAWIKFENVSGAVTFAVQYEGTKLLSSGGNWSGYKTIASVSADTDWKYYEFAYTVAGEGGPLKTIYFANSGEGTATVCVDDVILYTPEGTNLMGEQGSCESSNAWLQGPEGAVTAAATCVSEGYEGKCFKLDGTDLFLKEYGTKVPAGKKYVYSAMVKVEKAEEGFAFSAIRNSLSASRDNRPLTEPALQKSEDVTAVTDGWTKISYVFTQWGDNANFYLMGFRMVGTGTVYIDNVSIVELSESPEAPAESMIKDGGMEKGFCVTLGGENVKDSLVKGINFKTGTVAEVIHNATDGNTECFVEIADELTLTGKAKYNFSFEYEVKGKASVNVALVGEGTVYSTSVKGIAEDASAAVKKVSAVFEMPEITGTVTGKVRVVLTFGEVNTVVALDNFAFDCAHLVYAGVVTEEPTFDGEGEYKYGCVGCGKFDESKTEKIPSLGEEGAYSRVVIKEATCLEEGSESYTHEKYGTFTVTVPKKSHEMTEHAAKPHTCTEDGNVKYYSCALCGKNYADEKGETEIADVTDSAKHETSFVDTVYHTCTKDGNIEHYHCAVCGKNFADEAGKTEIADVTDKAAHSLKKTEAKAATAEEDGNIEYYYCTVCKKYFKDASGTEEITLEQTVLTKEKSGCGSAVSASTPLWLVIMAIAGVAVVVIKRKKA